MRDHPCGWPLLARLSFGHPISREDYPFFKILPKDNLGLADLLGGGLFFEGNHNPDMSSDEEIMFLNVYNECVGVGVGILVSKEAGGFYSLRA